MIISEAFLIKVSDNEKEVEIVLEMTNSMMKLLIRVKNGS